jgi:hypothetical protein
MGFRIKFRSNRPGSPGLNGKVERWQNTNLEKFYATVELSDFGKIREQLAKLLLFIIGALFIVP